MQILTEAQNQETIPDLDRNCKFYFSGEWHSRTDYENRYELLTKLQATGNVRILVLEISKEYEFDFNRFVCTDNNDTYFLKTFHKGLLMNKPEKFDEYLKKVKKINEGFSDPSQKITVICADISPSLRYAMFKFRLIPPIGNTMNSTVIRAIKNAGRIGRWGTEKKNTPKQIRIAYELKRSLENNTQDWKDLYKDYFPLAKRAVNALYRNAKAYKTYTVMPDSVRERIIYENILEAYNDRPDVSYYGNFGQMHTLLNCDPSAVIPGQLQIASSMANLLNNTEGLKNKIFCMPHYYLSLGISSPTGTKYYTNDFLTEEERTFYAGEIKNKNRLYVPIQSLRRYKELNGMFNYLIISP